MFGTFHFGDLTNEYKIMYMIYVLSHNKFSLDTKTMYSKFDTKTINKMTKQIYELIIESSKPMKYKTSLLKALHKKYVLHIDDCDDKIEDVNLCEIIYNLYVKMSDIYDGHKTVFSHLFFYRLNQNIRDIENIVKLSKELCNPNTFIIRTDNDSYLKKVLEKNIEKYDILFEECFVDGSASKITAHELLNTKYTINVRFESNFDLFSVFYDDGKYDTNVLSAMSHGINFYRDGEKELPEFQRNKYYVPKEIKYLRPEDAKDAKDTKDMNAILHSIDLSRSIYSSRYGEKELPSFQQILLKDIKYLRPLSPEDPINYIYDSDDDFGNGAACSDDVSFESDE
jgi:hypothetical protein